MPEQSSYIYHFLCKRSVTLFILNPYTPNLILGTPLVKSILAILVCI